MGISPQIAPGKRPVFYLWFGPCQLMYVQSYIMKLLNLVVLFLLITGSAFSQAAADILAFNAEKANDAVMLTWTPSEADTNHFEIQRSNDGVNWSVVAIMFPFEDSEIHSYRYSDKTQFQGNAYYRIRQIDLDKSENFSKVKMISAGETKK
jgi:hypothetical protein